MNNHNELKTYGLTSGTDKISVHGYHRFFDKELVNFKNLNNIGILEIGISQYKSIPMWKSYFSNAFIYGIDINCEYNDDRVTVFKCDQSDINALEIVKNKISHPIYFINDDGSHLPEHQLISFDYLFSNVLNDGGVYIIEDIEVSYWRNGHLYGYSARYGYNNHLSIIEKFKLLVDYVNSHYLNENDKQILDLKTQFLSSKTKNSISSINFSQNCIIIKKKNEEDLQYNNNNIPYLWRDFL
jgi:hypothetical protein